MDTTGYLPLAAARSLQRSLDVTSNNLANSGTAGYRADRLVFESLLDQPQAQADKIAYGTDRLSYADTRQGAPLTTGNPLDVAVQGEGWFAYERADGQMALGRDGRFVLDAAGNLVTTAGHAVLDAGGGAINIPAEAGIPSIARDGTISDQNGELIGQLGVFAAPDIATWQRIGDSMFMPRDGATPLDAVETPVLVQGAIEQSNVNPLQEMVRMIQIQRAFDQNMAAVSNHDQLRRDTLSRLGQQA